MVGGTTNPNKSSVQTQTFIMPLNTKVRPHIFKTTYWVGEQRCGVESSYLSDARVRGIRLYADNYQGKDIPKFELSFYADNKPFVDENGIQDAENKVRNVYKIQSSFSLKGRELLNNVASAIVQGYNEMSISIKPAFGKNEKTGKYDVPIRDKEGNQVYNILVFVPKEGGGVTRVMPLFANADFCDHPLKDEYIKVEEKCKDAESGNPARKFWEEFISNELQKKAFEMYQADMKEKGIEVEVEDWDEYKLKHILPQGSTDQTSDDEVDAQNDEVPEPTNAGADDDLPF